jgi:hypothetical protein
LWKQLLACRCRWRSILYDEDVASDRTAVIDWVGPGSGKTTTRDKKEAGTLLACVGEGHDLIRASLHYYRDRNAEELILHALGTTSSGSGCAASS